MRRMLIVLAAAVVVAAVPTSLALGDRGHRQRTQATLTLFRAVCGGVDATTQHVGSVPARAESDNRGEGEGNGTRLEATIHVVHGMPSASYRIFLLRSTGAGTCAVQFRDGVLRTNRHGVGSRELELRNVRLPAGRYALQLVAPANATVPGPGPFKDVLTTRFGLTVPRASGQEDEHH